MYMPLDEIFEFHACRKSVGQGKIFYTFHKIPPIVCQLYV